LDGEIGGAEVGIENVVKHFLGGLRDGAELGDARIGKEDVDPAVLLAHRLEDGI
jgi:hypothetical protein